MSKSAKEKAIENIELVQNQSIVEMILRDQQWSFEEFMDCSDDEIWDALVEFLQCSSA